jgi:hypothetical protein
MPRFYFNVHEEGRHVEDEHGKDLADAHEAEQQAIATALTIAGDVFTNRRADELTVEVRDEQKMRLFMVALTMRAEQVGLADGFVPAN